MVYSKAIGNEIIIAIGTFTIFAYIQNSIHAINLII